MTSREEEGSRRNGRLNTDGTDGYVDGLIGERNGPGVWWGRTRVGRTRIDEGGKSLTRWYGLGGGIHEES